VSFLFISNDNNATKVVIIFYSAKKKLKTSGAKRGKQAPANF
jgi:hypothetical protein